MLIVLLIAAALVPRPEFLAQKSIFSAVTHHFWHVNVFHLAVNSIGIWLAVSPGRRMSEMLPAWVAASLSYVFAPGPVLGFSNILFALAGMDAARRPRCWWTQPTTLAFLATMLLMVFLPAFSAYTHIASFALGFLYGAVRKAVNQTLSDYGRIARR